MKNILNKSVVLFILISGNNLLAEDVKLSDKYILANAYIKQYKGNRTLDETKKLLEQPCFIDANSYLYDEDKQRLITTKSSSENKERRGKEIQYRVPNYGIIIQKITKCVDSTSNPIAAFEGLYIINTFLGINYSNTINDYKKFSEILYKDKSCSGFIAMGDKYKKGLASKVDKKKALKIYEEGYSLCKEGWYTTALEMRISQLKRDVE